MRRSVSSDSLTKSQPDKINLSSFGLHIFRRECLELFPDKYTEAYGFMQLAFDLVQAQIQSQVPELLGFNTPGPDGTIDFFGHKTNGHIILGECKVRKNLMDAKKAIKYLAANLTEILELSDAATAAACYERFRNWRDKGLEEYIYCISYSFESDAEKQSFKELMQRTFRKLAKKSGGNSLSTLKITLYDWNDLKGFLENNNFLYQKWVETNDADVVEMDTMEENEEEDIPSVEKEDIPPKRIQLPFKDYLESYLSTSREEYLKLHPETQQAEPVTGMLEPAYNAFVSKKILGKMKTVLPLEADFFTYPPSFALFLHYIHNKFKEKFPKKQLNEGKSFRSWLSTRLQLSFPSGDLLSQQRDRKEICYLLTLMPCSASVTRILPGTYHAIIANLIHDGWLQEEEEGNSSTGENVSAFKGSRVIHPRIADEMLMFHLETIQEPLLQEILEIIHFAIEYDSFESCFQTFDRISDWQGFRNGEQSFFYPILSDLIGQYGERLGGADKFVMTSLLTEEERARLVVEFLDFFTPVIRAESFTLPLHDLLNCFSQKKKKGALTDGEKESMGMILKLWFPAHPDFIDNEKLGLSILSNVLIIFGKTTYLWEGGPLLTECVQKSARQNSADGKCEALIISWLKVGGDKESIQNAMVIWLNRYANLIETALVVQAWLEVGGDKEMVRSAMVIWLDLYPNIAETSFVIKAWLKAGGDKEAIKESLEIWLNAFQNTRESSFVIQAWLDAGGDKKLVKNALEIWLRAFPKEIETSFVIKSWLDAGGDTVKVKEIVETWVATFPHAIQASFMIHAWLKAGGDKEGVKNAIQTWLNLFPNTLDASFVIQTWLEAGGSTEAVRDALMIWLRNFAYTKQARFVIQAWFGAGGDRKIIKNTVGDWLNISPITKDARVVIQAWLESEGGTEEVKNALAMWLAKFPDELDTSFVIKSWLDAGGDPEVVRPYVKPWLEKYPLLKEETSFIIKTWLNFGKTPEDIQPFIILWLDKFYNCYEATYVIKAWLNNTNDLAAIQHYAFKWLRIFRDKKDADFVIKRLTRSKDIPEDTLRDIIFWCQKYSDYNEVLFKLANLIRDYTQNQLIADQWLIDILSKWIAQKDLKIRDIINLEIMIFNLTGNKSFAASEACTQLFIEWFLSEHSFNRVCLGPKFRFVQVAAYFHRYYAFITTGKINPAVHADKIQKFLRWVNGWIFEERSKIQEDVDSLSALIRKEEKNNYK